jgi:sterol 24-C-methyltransferase
MMVAGLEKVGIAPAGSRRVSQLLNMAADNLVAGGERNIFTPMFLYVVRKPLVSTETVAQ